MVEPLETGPLSDAELEAIAARCAAATPGPWRSFVEGRDHLGGNDFIQTVDGDGPDIELTGTTLADQDFIAEARQDIPRLLAEVRRLRGPAGSDPDAEPGLHRTRPHESLPRWVAHWCGRAGELGRSAAEGPIGSPGPRKIPGFDLTSAFRTISLSQKAVAFSRHG